MANDKAFKMIEDRFSEHVKRFNHAPVTEYDGDTQYWLNKEKADLARAALERAPEVRVVSLPRSLGDIYRATRTNLTPEELTRWEEINTQLEELDEKYGV